MLQIKKVDDIGFLTVVGLPVIIDVVIGLVDHHIATTVLVLLMLVEGSLQILTVKRFLNNLIHLVLVYVIVDLVFIVKLFSKVNLAVKDFPLNFLEIFRVN